jgi:8-oxo-dGTP pyrophosphatase MutT (NUDIX family)
MSEGRWRVETARAVLETKYFRVVRSAVRRPDGSLADYHTVDHPRPAVAVILRDGGRLALIRQHRFIVERDVWALPSGGVDERETPEAAARRELVEETGYEARSVTHLLSYYPSYGVSNQVFHCYLAEGAVAARAHDANEVQAVAWFEPDAVRAMIAAGDIPDGFSLTPLLYLMAGVVAQPPAEADRCRRIKLDGEAP